MGTRAARAGNAGRARAAGTSKAERAGAVSVGPIVSSAHLASGVMPVLSELEFGMILLDHAFERWMVRCIAAAGVPDLSPLDVLVLHTIAHRGRAKRVADICLVLNIEDTHLVTYSLKKLDSHKLLLSGKRGSEKTVSLTPKGEEVVQRYRKIREALLVQSVKSAGMDDKRLSEIAALMRALSGHYDQAARAAASL
ncbi:winged helix DNA-binding protein [Undibacter mobilis]|uniref:Transcriptional regulator n=1 Tax=Undibacter mobilis TaxID=2292256 RepID=A0A371BBK2_9BRAD|nr:winged helix DNA-binding protein [Undibacter mobilis]RDV04954.1 transcriptional regulator [Undibacter mobilis]